MDHTDDSCWGDAFDTTPTSGNQECERPLGGESLSTRYPIWYEDTTWHGNEIDGTAQRAIRRAEDNDDRERAHEIAQRLARPGVLHAEMTHNPADSQKEQICEIVEHEATVLRLTQTLDPTATTIIDLFTPAGWTPLLTHRHYFPVHTDNNDESVDQDKGSDHGYRGGNESEGAYDSHIGDRIHDEALQRAVIILTAHADLPSERTTPTDPVHTTSPRFAAHQNRDNNQQ